MKNYEPANYVHGGFLQLCRYKRTVGPIPANRHKRVILPAGPIPANRHKRMILCACGLLLSW